MISEITASVLTLSEGSEFPCRVLRSENSLFSTLHAVLLGKIPNIDTALYSIMDSNLQLTCVRDYKLGNTHSLLMKWSLW